jgi:DNA-binding CsgD family transcriptional regulator
VGFNSSKTYYVAYLVYAAQNELTYEIDYFIPAHFPRITKPGGNLMTTAKTISVEEKLAYSVDGLPLRIRGCNLLKHLGIKTIQDLVNTDAKELLAVPNCGKKTVAEIVACLKMVGFKMKNSEGMFSDEVIEQNIASIKSYLTGIREEERKRVSFQETRAIEIKQKQILVMQMRANGATNSAIAKEIGRNENMVRIYFSRLGRAFVREAKKRAVAIEEILSENNIPLTAIQLLKNDGIYVCG